MPIGPDELKLEPNNSVNLEEVVKLWVKHIDDFLSSNPKLRRTRDGACGFSLTSIRKRSPERLPRVTWQVRKRLQEIYVSAGWDKVEFHNDGNEVFLHQKPEKHISTRRP